MNTLEANPPVETKRDDRILNVDLVRQIRELSAEGRSRSYIAWKLKINEWNVSSVIYGKAWVWVK
jgi:hypothetical protein